MNETRKNGYYTFYGGSSKDAAIAVLEDIDADEISGVVLEVRRGGETDEGQTDVADYIDTEQDGETDVESVVNEIESAPESDDNTLPVPEKHPDGGEWSVARNVKKSGPNTGTLRYRVLEAINKAPEPITANELVERMDGVENNTSISGTMSHLYGDGFVARRRREDADSDATVNPFEYEVSNQGRRALAESWNEESDKNHAD